MEQELREVAEDGGRWLDYGNIFNMLLIEFAAGFKGSKVFGLSNWRNGVVVY